MGFNSGFKGLTADFKPQILFVVQMLVFLTFPIETVLRTPYHLKALAQKCCNLYYRNLRQVCLQLF